MSINNIQAANVLAKAGGAESASPENRQKLAGLAAEFESMLLMQMVREMSESGKWSSLGEGGTETLGADTFDKTFQLELSRYLSKAGGLGLSQQLVKALDAMNAQRAGETASQPAAAGFAGITNAARTAATAGGFTRMPAGAQVLGRPADMNDPYDVFHYHVGTGAANPLRNTQSETDYFNTVIKPMFDAYGMESELMPASAAGIADTIRVKDPRTGAWREVDILGQGGTWWGEAGGVPGQDAPMTAVNSTPAGARPNDRAGAPLHVPASAVTSAYGWRQDPFTGEAKFHKGVDLRAPEGSEVRSAGAGRVVFAGANGGYGTSVVVQHANGLSTRYAHLSELLVRVGDEVGDRQLIGLSGQTGRATAAHLHFEVLDDGVPVDPLRSIP